MSGPASFADINPVMHEQKRTASLTRQRHSLGSPAPARDRPSSRRGRASCIRATRSMSGRLNDLAVSSAAPLTRRPH